MKLHKLNKVWILAFLTLILCGHSKIWGINFGQVLEKAAQDYVNKNKPAQPQPAPNPQPEAQPQPSQQGQDWSTNQGATEVNILGKRFHHGHSGMGRNRWRNEVHAIQIHHALKKWNPRRRFGGGNTVYVEVDGNRPGYLFLSSYESTQWVINGQTQLVRGVHVHAFNRSSVSGVDPNLVETDSYYPYDRYIPERAPASSPEPGDALIKFSQETGFPIGSSQGSWEANSFTVYMGN